MDLHVSLVQKQLVISFGATQSRCIVWIRYRPQDKMICPDNNPSDVAGENFMSRYVNQGLASNY